MRELGSDAGRHHYTSVQMVEHVDVLDENTIIEWRGVCDDDQRLASRLFCVSRSISSTL